MLKPSSEFNRKQNKVFHKLFNLNLNLNLCKLIVQIFDISILDYLINRIHGLKY